VTSDQEIESGISELDQVYGSSYFYQFTNTLVGVFIE